MDNAVKPGNILTIAAPANLVSGTPIIFGTMLAIPIADATSGDDAAVQVEGVVELPKLSSAVISAGAKVIWDVSAGQVIIASAAAGDLNNFGVAVKAAGNGATTVKVKLLPASGSLAT